jgi:hypothetical protein
MGLMIFHACDGWWLVMRCEWWGKVVVAAVVVNMVVKKSKTTSGVICPQCLLRHRGRATLFKKAA